MSLQPIDVDSAIEPLFREEQRFTQVWMWAVVAITAIACWGIAAAALGATGVGLMLFALLVLAGGFAPALLLVSKMTTEVREDGVYVHYRPFHLRQRRFAFDEIETIAARRYSPLLDYGGWGIRGLPGNWAYNVKGDNGVQIVMRSGTRILIGTQKPEEFMAAVNAARVPQTEPRP